MQREPIMIFGRGTRTRGRVWTSRVWWLARIAAGVLLGAGLFDRVIMPRVVGQGTDSVVPELTGQTVNEGRRRLERTGLVAGRVLEVSHPTVGAGRVVRQDPAPGAHVRRGRAIQLVVSRGTPEREVPDLTGLTVRHAGVELSQRGLQMGELVELPSAERADGEILGTRPAAGEEPSPSGKVDLLVSSGEARVLYQMPDLRGRDFREAEEMLRSVGIAVTTRPGTITIFRQAPAAGEPIWSGSTAHLE
jgi:serine/threonine-protein kinase